MFKLGRGGGGGGGRGNGKRPLAGGAPPPSSSLRRPSPAAARGPPSGRNRPPTSSSAAAAAEREESFRLESDGVLDFGAIIRLTPDLVEEIRRVESRGGSARIKFDSSSNNQTGNIIDVGGKEFKFTWSNELGDLCDIYEERQSGEYGNGLLVECGSSWRKLNVQRILDESTQNLVKMRSEEAERLFKSRKSIVLDPTNPSVKAKSMALAAVEGNMRRMGWKNKKEFFNKRNVEATQASGAGLPKSVSKTGSLIKNSKGRPSVSPNLSPPEQNLRGSSTSPFGIDTLFGDDSSYDPIAPSNLNREDARRSDKDTPSRGINAVQNDTNGQAVGNGEQMEKLRSMLISTLSDNPKGMSLKDLEKMIGGTIPNCGRKILSIIKEVAVSGASGTYLLKPHLRKVSESGSSPDCLDDHRAVKEIVRTEKNTNVKFQHQASTSVNPEKEPDWFEKIDIAQNNEEPFAAEGKSNNESEDRARSSSESGSDSDSDSSDSGSRSKSPAGSGSASSSDSDSDSDGSSSSKEGSDVDVDILSDDQKDIVSHKVVAPEPNTSPLPTLSKYDHERNNFSEDQHMHSSSSPIDLNNFQYYDRRDATVETKKELPVSGENNAFESPGMTDIYSETSRVLKAASFRSPNQEKQLESPLSYYDHSTNNVNELVPKSNFSSKQSMLKDNPGVLHETPGRTSKSKSKRPSSDHFKGKPGGNKRAKSISSTQNLLFDKNKEHSSFNLTQPNITDIYEQDGSRGNEMQITGTIDLDKGFQTNSWDSSPAMHAKNAASKIPHKVPRSPDLQRGSGLAVEHSAHGIGDLNSRKKDLENADRLDNSYRREYGEPGRMSIDNGQQWGKKKSDAEKISSSVGKGSVLRRELSELELGELRETNGVEEYQDVRRQMDREGSFKSLPTNIHPNNLDLGISKGITNANPTPEPRKQSPVTSKAANQRNDSNQRKQPKDNFMGPDRNAYTQVRPMPSMNEQIDNVDHAGSISMLAVDKTIEKCKNDGRLSQGVVLERNGAVQKKISADMLPHYDNRSVSEMNYKTTNEQKTRKSNLQRNSTDQARNVVSVVNEIDDRRGRDPPSDEDNSLYLKYDKDNPELKGAIKDLSQYKEYLEEYQEKYEVYCSLNKKLENIRNNFLQFGRDLEIAKGRDMEEYFMIVEKLKTTYQQYNEKNKKMKRVFILLHDELKNLKQRIKDFAESITRD